MITWLARRNWGRIALLPVITATGAFSWGTYSVEGRPDDKKAMWSNFWGWLSPAMEEHWDMLGYKNTPGRKSTFHELKNVGTEYHRTWPQTAFKANSFIAVCLVLAVLLAGFLAGMLVML
jgi:hypothetical protein